MVMDAHDIRGEAENWVHSALRREGRRETLEVSKQPHWRIQRRLARLFLEVHSGRKKGHVGREFQLNTGFFFKLFLP